MPSRHCILLVLAVALGGFARETRAADFGVTTTVESAERQRLQQTTTLFVQGKAYDFGEDESREVMALDFDRGQVTLLAPGQKEKATIELIVLDQLIDTVRQAALAEGHRPLVRFAADPQFERSWDPAQQRLTLSSRWVNYSTQLFTPPDQSAVNRYRNFADVSARLATLAPGLPPQPRLQLNEEIARQECLPAEVTKQLEGHAYTSRHEYSWQLDDVDYQQIARIEEAMDAADAVELIHYLGKHRP